MRSCLLPLVIALSLGACAPKALYFHESTKVAFAADYNTSDTQPLATSLGYKRRIVAVVPAQERIIPDGGTERNGTNTGEALSLVSKFSVRAGAREGIVITNNFASGMAARIMTRSVGSPDSLNVLMHSAPIPVSAATGETANGRPATEVVNDRLSRIMGKRTRSADVPASRRSVDLDESGALKSDPRPADTGRKSDGAKPGAQVKKNDVPASTRTVDLAGDGNLKTNGQPPVPGRKTEDAKPIPGPKKANVPASRTSVDLTPDGEVEIKKR